MKKRFEKILKGLYRYELEKIYIPLKNGSEALEMAINLLTNLDANIATSTTFCFKKKRVLLASVKNYYPLRRKRANAFLIEQLIYPPKAKLPTW